MNLRSNEYLTFDDVLLLPGYSNIKSRRDVDLSSMDLKLPVISANMDTITGAEMAIAMGNAGASGALHRFWSIEDNVKAFVEANIAAPNVMASVGIGDKEKERAEALVEVGAKILLIDVAHGAQLSVVEQVRFLRDKYKDNVEVVVGNFATGESIRHFCLELNDTKLFPDAFKVGIGPGSVCTTRIKTGVGVPQLYAIIDCVNSGFPIVADGGLRNSGDIAKALAAGAKAVMIGGMLAGTTETPGIVYNADIGKSYKIYRGSASKESYDDQGKNSDWRTTEGVTAEVSCKGSVKNILADIEGGLRSAFTYVGASNLEEFQKKATFVRISNSTLKENSAHVRS